MSAEGENFNSGFLAQSGAAGNAGTIVIEAQRLRLTDGAVVSVSADDAGDAGTIIVRANDVELFNGLDSQNPSVLDGSVKPVRREDSGSGTGSGGSVTVEAERVVLRNGGRIEARTANGTGESGQITIIASESVELSGIVPDETGSFGSSIFTNTTGSADGGDITIITPSLSVRDRSGITASSDENATGNAGDIRILATDSVEIIGLGIDEPTVFVASDTFGAGNGGNINIETGKLTVAEGGGIGASANDGSSGRAGNIRVIATEEVVISDGFLQATTSGVGNGGDITINTEGLVLNEAIISTGSFLRPEQNTPGGGDAGNVNIDASEWVELKDNSGIFASTRTTGDAGNVTIQTETFRVLDGSIIFVNSESSGIPGNIDITATSTLLDNQSFISADSEVGQGGNIRLQSNDVRLFNRSGIVAVGSESGQTFEGNIEIDVDLLVLLSSAIFTDAFSPSGGSNINIRPLGLELGLLQSQDSNISAAGELSIDDTLNFDPPESLEVNVVDPAALIAQDPCKQGQESEFMITGRGGIAPDPTQSLSGIEGLIEWESFLVEPVTPQVNRSSRRHQKNSRKRDNHPVDSRTIIPARGWIRTEKGEVILVGYDPTKTGVQRQPQQSQNQCHSEE